MKEQRFFHNQPPAAVQPSPHPNQFAIKINWREDASIVVKMRRGHVQMATHGNGVQFKPVCSQADDMQFASDADRTKIFTSRSGRKAL